MPNRQTSHSKSNLKLPSKSVSGHYPQIRQPPGRQAEEALSSLWCLSQVSGIPVSGLWAVLGIWSQDLKSLTVYWPLVAVYNTVGPSRALLP